EGLAQAADGCSGAEVEQAIVSAMYFAYAQGREFTGEDVLAALADSVPLSRTMGEDIAALRAWAAERARPASGD
ncbi:MAG: AAA family ATPase, partial [Planctomycetes bacterium]|nr:AAA family ATPase [Planctomycetota bacterium]